MIDYRARPYVCGAIGPWNEVALRRLLAAGPGGLREVASSRLATVWASGPLERWADGSRHGLFWSPAATGCEPRSWRTAAEERLAAGLVASDHEAILHTCGLGIQEIYVRHHGEAAYFSARIDPLLELADSRLHIDWSAWASVLALTAPMGAETPFQEIRRLEAATALRADGTRLALTRFTPRWLRVEPNDRREAAEIVELVAERVREGTRPQTLLLSGGWDSRLLAILMRRGARDVPAWTTSNDDGFDLDLTLAKQVAEELGITHHLLVPDAEAWARERPAVTARVQFQTTHHVWLMPLARQLRTQKNALVDGFAGDVLLKSLFVDDTVVGARAHPDMCRAVWNRLSQRRLTQSDLLAKGLGAAFEESSRAGFDRAIDHLDGHPAAPTLAVLLTRTARAIGPAPLWILGPESEVRMPFVHPDVVACALEIPLTAKIGGAFYRALLEHADPRVAALPSTNDVETPGRRGERRNATPYALSTMAQAILGRPEISRIFSYELLLALRDPTMRPVIARSMNVRRLLQWGSLLAEWHNVYAGRLAPLDLPI